MLKIQTHTLMRGLLFTIIAAAAGLVLPHAARAQSDAPPAKDLGERMANETYPFKLVAQNLNCNNPQDFRFNLDEMPFILALEDPVARQVAFGQSKSLDAVLDLTGAEPGFYQGVMTIDCETCVNIPFVPSCRADRQTVSLQLTVIANPNAIDPVSEDNIAYEPPFETDVNLSEIGGPTDKTEEAEVGGPTGPPNAIAQEPSVDCENASTLTLSTDECGPAVELTILDGFEVGLDYSLDPEMRAHLTSAQKNNLRVARNRYIGAVGTATDAAKALEDVRKKKGDCWEEVERLRMEQAAKEAAASTADGTAADAQSQVDGAPTKALADAQKAVDNFQDDVDQAQRDYDQQTERALGQQRYLEQVIKEDPDLSTRKGKNAKKYYEEASNARSAAKKALDAVNASMAPRIAARDAAKAALDAAQKAADAKRAEATAAREAAKAAAEAADAKERECLGLDANQKEKEKAANNARAAMAGAKRDAESAEKVARGQAVANLRDEIKNKKKQCENLQKMWDKHFKQMQNAKKALYQSGYYKRRDNASKAKEPNSPWDDYKKLGYDKFIELAAQASEARVPGGVPTAGNVAILFDILEAAYRVAGIVQSAYTPDTYMHGRTEGQGLRDWLVKNNFADASPGDVDAREVENQMRRLKDPKVEAKDTALAIVQIERCKRELAALQAKLAANQ